MAIMATSIPTRFDEICFSFGDSDAIELHTAENEDEPPTLISYFELQEHSKNLSHQLYWRYRPDFVLIDCQGWPAAEAIATLACMRLNIPFVPVSCYDQHRPGRLNAVVDLLRKQRSSQAFVVAVTVCENDRDPILSVFQKAGVHQILYLDKLTGGLKEQLRVPDVLPEKENSDDDLYVLFTSGTSSQKPKAVVGSHKATIRRIQWFLDTFPSKERIGRRSKLTFVDGVTEIWSSLLDEDMNNVLVGVRPQILQRKGIAALINKCNQLLLLPSQLNQLLMLPKSSTLQRVLVSGEVLSSALVQGFFDKYSTDCALINLYGQTESTGDICCCVLDPRDSIVDNVVAIGKPILNSIELSLSPDNNEIIIQGPDQLANGYLQESDPHLRGTFDRFHTGDAGFCKDGIWFVKGRQDDVKKINGVWTSPSEMEAAFTHVYQVNQPVCAVLLPSGEMVVSSCLLCSDEQVCQSFSRETMHELGIPWNLIPQRVFFFKMIPTTTGGAGKIDRKACLSLVTDALMLKSKPSEEERRPSLSFLSIVANILGISESKLDPSKSFVELGGDSLSSIAVLYRTNTLDGKADTNITAIDILNADSLADLHAKFSGNSNEIQANKRFKSHSASFARPFQAELMKQHADPRHKSLSLFACVDSQPLVSGENGSIYVACQGGIVMRVDLEGKMQGFYQLFGYMIQASLTEYNGSIIVCAYSSDEERGLVLALSLDLKTELWKVELEGGIKASPALIDNLLWAVAGKSGTIIDVEVGTETKTFELPRTTIAKPLVFCKDGKPFVVYASSNWEACLMVVDSSDCRISIELEYEIGPVHKDLAIVDGVMLIADSYGTLNMIKCETMEIISAHKLSMCPLSPPLLIGDGSVIVGSYDGNMHCVKRDSSNDSDSFVWKCNIRSSIYSKPSIVGDKLLACTTAGDIVSIDSSTGKVEWSTRIPAEIWSDLLLFASASNNFRLVFGARDSSLHIFDIK